MGFIFSKLIEALFATKLEICLLGLESTGKTTFVDALVGKPKKNIPTIGLNVKMVKKGSKNIYPVILDLNMKIWDIGGQFQYRQNWVDYAKIADVIIFMVDSSNFDTISVAKKELHSLLEEKGLEGRPLLILSNKIDIEPHMTEVEIIKELNLDYVYTNQWVVIPLSALKGTNLEQVIEWLTKKGKK